MQPGIESLSTEVLKVMRKGVTAIQNIQLLKWGREQKIAVTWSILYGFPGEKREHYEATLRTIPFITHLQPPAAVPIIVLQRFSPYHFDADRLGIRNLKPASMYRNIYPESRVNLNDIAYFFDYTLDESAEDPREYIKPVRQAADKWKSAYYKTRVFFRYRKGAGFIELQDNRPLDGFQLGHTRKTILAGIESQVYLLCDSIKSFREINDFVKARTNPGWSDEQVKALLDRFIQQKLIFEEKGRYLALATAARPKRASAAFKAEQASLPAATKAATANAARTLKVLDLVAGSGRGCGEQLDGALG
jgi:ribosomal peptide maturation radical SAM protein 1